MDDRLLQFKPLHTPNIFKGTGCNDCGMTSIAEQQHNLPNYKWRQITFAMPDKLCPLFANNWSLLNPLFSRAANTLLRWAKKLSIEIGLFVALHTYGRQLNQHPHIHDPWRVMP